MRKVALIRFSLPDRSFSIPAILGIEPDIDLISLLRKLAEYVLSARQKENGPAPGRAGPLMNYAALYRLSEVVLRAKRQPS
jgi:hypothetical protein